MHGLTGHVQFAKLELPIGDDDPSGHFFINLSSIILSPSRCASPSHGPSQTWLAGQRLLQPSSDSSSGGTQMQLESGWTQRVWGEGVGSGRAATRKSTICVHAAGFLAGHYGRQSRSIIFRV